jgi:L-lactate dehydrogenase
MRIGVVGMGWVGASVAMSTLHSGIATELLLHDMKTGLAEGEALDLGHGAPFYPACAVRPSALEDMRDADAVVIAAGRGSHPGETRLDLARENAAIVSGISRTLTGMRGLLILVTNPVDVMTQVAAHASGLPRARVIGTGTMLDTARLRYVLGRELGLDARAIHAQVVGEHGDSEVALWSSAHVGGAPLRQWPGWHADREGVLADQVRRAAYEIISRKGATNHAIGLVAADLLRTVLRGERRILTVSRVQDGAAGIHDIALSLPAVIDGSGATQVVTPQMDAVEMDALLRSADVLRRSIASL